jgi:heterodisulfide reductase subunit C
MLQEDIDLIKQEAIKQALYSQVLYYLEQASNCVIKAGSTHENFEKEISIARENIKTAEQLYTEWIKVNEQYTSHL